MTDKNVPAIYEAIHAVKKEMPALAKNGVGPQTQGSYKFLSVDDILAAVGPLEVKHGIVSYLVDTEMEFHYNRATDKGDGRVPRESVQGFGHFTFRYVSIKDGSHVDHVVPAEGIDTQDKATRKTVTQAQKIANITLYDIVTGEADPDSQDGGADNQAVPSALKDATKATKAVSNRASTSQGGYHAKIKSEFLDTERTNLNFVKSVVEEVKKETKATGESLYEEAYNRIKGRVEETEK